MNYEFQEMLQFSKQSATGDLATTLLEMMPGAQSVTATATELDKKGVDYVVNLNGDARVYVDLKVRSAGCSKWWTDGPELALEVWSVTPERARPGKIGWTLDDSKLTHMTLHVFDPGDSDCVYLLPFQHLRCAFRRYGLGWYRQYKHAKQSSGGWRSECVFVPARVVVDAITRVMHWR